MDIQILAVPYDSGIRDVRMGAGPQRLIEAGLQRALTAQGHHVTARIASLRENSWHGEIQASFELMAMLAREVAAARAASCFPIVLSGNCSTSVGTLTGLGADVGVVWFDAHADFNTPETTTSGFFDGNALAIVTGRCWKPLAAKIGFVAVSDQRVCLIGARDIDPLERELLDESSVSVVEPSDLHTRLIPSLKSVAEHVERVYVHIDLDVLDVAIAPANSYSKSGGFTVEDVEYALAVIADELEIAAVTLSAYDPAGDRDGRAAEAAIRLLCNTAQHANRA
jgi:arginase